MDRNIQTRAIVLSVRKYGELHKALTLLCPDLGLVDAIIFGGRKGKKTALAPLFSINDLQIYHNPVKKEYSITEGVSTFIPQAINEDLACTYTAAFFCEIIAKSPTDEPNQTFVLLEQALTQLEANPSLRRRIAIAFIWILMQISGTAPDLEFCPVCDRRYADDEVLHLSNGLQTPCCRSCADSEYLVLPPGARRYLRFITGMDIKAASEVQLSESAESRIYNYMLRWAGLFSQTRLKTLDELLNF
ncbi:MAG: DNA repair protein RecO [Spirochaetales bacterium]|nr:DNA repair protein RecO [Spirochaetales bacterium]